MAREVRWRLVLDASGFNSVADQAAKKWESFAAGAITAAGAIKIVTDALKAQSEQEDAINKLNLALANQGKYTDVASQSLIEYSAALQGTSTYADEVILAGEALLASFGMNEAQIKTTTQAAIDFSAATGTDLNASMTLLGKAFAGNTAQLGRYGIVVDQSLSKSEKFDAAIQQLTERFGGSGLAATQTYAGGMKQLQNAINDAQEGLGKFLGELMGGGAPFSTAIGWAKSLAQFFAVDMVLALSEVRAKMLEMFATLVDLPKGLQAVLKVGARVADPLNLTGINDLLKDLTAGGKEAAKSLRDQAAAVREAGNQAAISYGKIQKFANQPPPKIVDTEALKKQNEEAARIQKIADETMAKLRVDAIKTVNAQLEGEYKRNVKVIEQLLDDWVEEEKQHAESVKQIKEALAKDGEDFMKSWEEQVKREHEALMKFFDDLKGLGDAIGSLGSAIGGKLGSVVSGIGQFTSQLASSMKQAHEATSAYQLMSMAIAGVAQAYQGGVSSASPGKGALKGALSGAATGAAIGSVIPGVGTVVGGVVGGVIGGVAGFLGGKKGQADQLKAQADQLKTLHAQLAALEQQAKQTGLVFNESFNPNDITSMTQAVNDLNQALGLQSAANNALHDAMDRYGISIGQLGPEFAKQELDKQAAQLLQDYSLLTAAGVDHNAIIAAMGPNLQNYVNMAIQSGTAIPEAMRPIIQAMIDQGLLLDQNGQAYTSVEQAGLSFTQTMSEQFGTLIGKITDLVNALLGIPSNVNTNINVNKNYTHSGDDPGGDGGRDGNPLTPLAGGFEGMVTQPRTFLVGEAGPEYMSVRKPGESPAGFNMGALESKLDGLRNDFRRYSQSQAGSIRDAVLLGRA